MLVLGISGATCSGKTTICNILRRIFVNSRVFNQDDYYWPEDSKNHIRDENSIINWEVMSSFNMNSMYTDIHNEIKKYADNQKKSVTSRGKLWKPEDVFVNTDSYDTKLDPADFEHVRLIIVEGILVLNDTRISDLCDKRYFLELDYETCWHRRQSRTYDPEDQEGYFKKYAWPYYLANLKEFEGTGRQATFLNGAHSIQTNLCSILNGIS
eukprot:TRINITY_DN12015_c0_g1_i1.p1 TRINITY_DN12015_c0_g1~~TRINITY_DN12015_c0_g1_i1.p1  ORF type:complete len:211 (+),score=17.98 TRINITY_DN12015_c0_g1_i1:311-943(+)